MNIIETSEMPFPSQSNACMSLSLLLGKAKSCKGEQTSSWCFKIGTSQLGDVTPTEHNCVRKKYVKYSDAKITIVGKVSKSFNVLQGVTQEDGLSTFLFNLALDKVLKELKWNGNMLYKFKQPCAYADDKALIARNMPALQETLITLQEME
jgi:hypothetical protein